MRANYETIDIPSWVERSKRFLESAEVTRDIVYGPRERNTLDFYPAANSDGTFVLYIHGGYWQRGDKSVYSFMAEPFVASSVSVAVMNYQMCPDAHLAEIAPQARFAVAFLWRNSGELGISRDNFNVMGQSAGGASHGRDDVYRLERAG